MIKTIKVKDKEFKLEFTSFSIIKIEKEIEKGFFSQFAGREIESVEDKTRNFKASIIFTMFYGCLQKHHRVADVESAANIADAWFEEGHTLMDLATIVFDVFNTSNVLNLHEQESIKPNVPDYAKDGGETEGK